MSAFAFVAVFALGGAVTLFVVHVGRKAVRGWRLISALEREQRQDSPGLSIVPAVADGTAPAPASHRLPKRHRGEALTRMDAPTVALSLRALDEATHELAHLHLPARTEIAP